MKYGIEVDYGVVESFTGQNVCNWPIASIFLSITIYLLIF